MQKPRILKAADTGKADAPWGSLTWYASATLGNSEDMTVGRCIIKPGSANPLHSHPNCSETLVVMQGRISHTVDSGKNAELGPGDTVTIPPNFVHQAKNIGQEDAVLFIAFSSADRKTKGE